MTTLVGVYLLVVALALCVVMLRDHARGTVELFSCRNIAIGGFILFQLTSAAVALFNPDLNYYHYLNRPVQTALTYAAMVSVFMLLANMAYRRGWIVRKLAWRVPATQAAPGDTFLLAMAVVLTIIAAILRFTVRVPLIGIMSTQFGSAFAALACGVVGWVWGRRLLNPALILYATLIVAVNFGIAMSSSFGRRTLVAVGAGLLWGMYYSHWRYLRTGAILHRLVLLSIPSIIVVALFTSVRKGSGSSTGEQVQEISAKGDLKAGLIDLAGGQNCGGVSMWLVERHPESFERRPLMTIWHFLIYPVPRVLWPTKPRPIGQLIPRMAVMTRVDYSSLSIGAGIIGTANAEGGWYAVVIYALLGGLMLRFLDEIASASDSPFVILPIGCALGQVLGLARGETSAFTFILLTNITATLLSMVVIGRLLERAGIGTSAPDEPAEGEYADEAGEEAIDPALAGR